MFNIYYADCIGREGNCLYPHKADVTDAASLAQAVSRDYVCAEYKNSYRSNANFISSNCLAVEFDNDHSENPDDWVTPEDLQNTFPEVTIGIHYSRNHMKEKNGKPARPKFHAFLEIEPITDPDAYKAMKQQVAAIFPYVDPKALDSAHFFYGTDNPQVEYLPGAKTLNEFLEEEDFDAGMDKGSYGAHVIKEGSRNATLSRFAGRVVKRYGWNDASHKIFLDEAAKCEPPLPEEELAKIWRSARKFEKVVTAQDGYVPPDQFNIAKLAGPAGCLKPEDYSDIGQAKILSKEYGDELCFNPATDYFRYNGTYWIESKEAALGATMEFLDQQLADAELLMFTTKQAFLNAGGDEAALAGGKRALNGLSDDLLKLLEEYLSALTYYKFVMGRRNIKYIRSAMEAFKDIRGRIETRTLAGKEIHYIKMKQENPETLQSSLNLISQDKRDKIFMLGFDEYLDFYPPLNISYYPFYCDMRGLQRSGVSKCLIISETLARACALRFAYDGFDEKDLIPLPDNQEAHLAAALRELPGDRVYYVEEIPYFKVRRMA